MTLAFAVLFVGLMGIEVPEKYNGSGMTFVQSVLAIEEISRIEPGAVLFFGCFSGN